MNSPTDVASKPSVTPTHNLGDKLLLRSGEAVKIMGRQFTPGGIAIWWLRCLNGMWFGDLHLTTHELDANAL